jgi:lipopolysaccharide transport system ATP-binding protein
MTSDLVIRVESLSKRFRIGRREPYLALRDALTSVLTAPFRAFGASGNGGQRRPDAFIWALNDVSFDVRRGEVVGIVGRNGAGKSTLLKVLSRITRPTAGWARVRGRLGSLLEVGTGFHPELTGRENVYLNGAILGMKKAEIARKFDEIVAFAEVPQFIDTPVKYYSSGMYVRLAFAVAAHTDPEILLVDEVLAVGDAAFQKKCLGKMSTVAGEGRTVLFVSHNMAAIVNLCPRAILLDGGRVVQDGGSGAVVDSYLRALAVTASTVLGERVDRKGNQSLRILAFQMWNERGERIAQAMSGERLTIALPYEGRDAAPLRKVHVAIGVHGKYDERLCHLSTTVSSGDFAEIPPNGTLCCRVPRLPLQPGRYSVNVFCTVAGDVADWVQGAGTIDVIAGDFFKTGKLPPPDQGVFLVDHEWDVVSSHVVATPRTR